MKLSANADIRKAQTLAEYGYDVIDVGLYRVIYHDDPFPHNPLLDEENFYPELDKHIEICKRAGIKIGTTHLPYRFAYEDPNANNYDYYHEMICRSLKASEYMGADWAVLHISKSPEATVSYVKRLFAETGVKKVGIAIENLSDIPIDDLVQAHDTLLSEGYRVGICLDTGHCNVNTYYDQDVAETVIRLGSRIKMLHVHDNMRNTDRHGVPYTGSIKWGKVMRALAEVDFEGDLNLELQPEKIPEGAREEFEKYSVAIGRVLIGMFDKHKVELAEKSTEST